MTQKTRAREAAGGLAPASPAVPDALLWEALPELQLNIAQTAALCGISVRQLGYWTKQSYVQASGRGARRLYGLNAVRGVLAIRQAMRAGASLRQAVRALEALRPLTPETLRQSGEEGNRDAQNGDAQAGEAQNGQSASAPRPAADRAVIAADLLALFHGNCATRDSAAGLADKIGRAEADVRQAAESLSAQGLLTRTLTQGEPIFQNKDA